MKRKALRERFFTFMNGAFYGSLITFCAFAGIITAFSLQLPPMENTLHRPLELTTILWYSIGFSLLFSLCFSVKRLWFLVPILVLGILGYGWKYGTLRENLFDFLYIISKRYNNAYSCGVIFLNEERPFYTDLTVVFRSLVIIGAAVTTWAACKRQSSYWVLILSLLCFVPCCVMTNTVPQSWVLFLWFLSLVLFLLTNHARKSSSQGSVVLGLYYIVPLLIALMLLFTLVPRGEYNGKERADTLLERFETIFDFSDSESGGTGTKTESSVDLSSLRDRKERNVPVMYITVPESGTYYLRGEAYGTYTGTQWVANETMAKLPWHDGKETDREIHIRTRFVHDMLFVPYCADPAVLSEGDMVLNNSDELKEYSFHCYTELSSLATSFTYPQMSAWCRLPMETSLWAKSLLDEIYENYKNNYPDQDKAKHLLLSTPEMVVSFIADYVQSLATYDLKPEKMDPSYTDFVKWFVEKGESGYCVHFAATAAVLLRAAGIPARYVTGYMVDAQANRETTVYQKHAHAWVEYWTVNTGWNVLEVTPARTEEVEVTTTQTEETTETTEPSTSTTETEETTETEAITESTDTDYTVNGNEAKSTGTVSALWKVLKWLLIPASLIVLAVGQRILRLFLWDKQYGKASRKQKALMAWNRSISYSTLLKQPPDPLLKALAEKAKFSQHTLSNTELESFSQFFVKSQIMLKKQSLFRRIYARWILVLY